MKKKDVTDLKTKTATELGKLVFDLRLQITKTHMELAQHKNKNVNLVKNLKKDLAQLLTIQKENASS